MAKDYQGEKEKIRNFLSTFYTEEKDENGPSKEFVYDIQLQLLADREEVAIHIDMDHVAENDPELAEAIMENTKRYSALFAEVIDELIQGKVNNREPVVKDALDAFIYQRIEMAREVAKKDLGPTEYQNLTDNDLRKKYPPELMRRFEIYFKHRRNEQPMSVRDVKAEHIGKLVTLRGIVIRATEVKPMASVITYTCDTCGCETYQPVSGPSFMPPVNCPSTTCVKAKANGRLFMQVRGSKFIKFQEIKIQEHSDQVPVGSIPRMVTMLVRGENTRVAAPGDHIKVTGVFLPHLRTGFRQMMQGLLSEVFIEVQSLEVVNTSEDVEGGGSGELTEEELESVSSDNFYDQMARSIAPEIFGHLDIKKSLLLQLISGVDKNSAGMKIRGALNICLMGDPGVAKSQLLGYIDRLAPRSQYTTGRGSSGVGLTASVAKDTVTGEWALDGGALVLADQGICCIDEFDKMMDSDRTAIHEVMEQQTISIAKAGIMTTLNARVSILAAANPAYGRYNPRRSIEHNINLPAALLSRFDLLWLIQDKPDRDNDHKLAEHITYVHAHSKDPVKINRGAEAPFSMDFIRRYVALCKRKQPQVPEELTGRFVDFYADLRKDARNNLNSTFTSARTVLAALRLSTALARLHLRDIVSVSDIDEACRLMKFSKMSLLPDQEARARKQSPPDRAYAIIREMLHSLSPEDPQELDYEEARVKCINKGIDDEAYTECLDLYSTTNVLMVNQHRTKIIFL